jgi:hypothetical protein
MPYMTNVNPNFNIYQNIQTIQSPVAGAKLSNVMPNHFSFYSNQSTNRIIGSNNSYNMYSNRMLTNPDYIGLNTNTFYNNPLE